MPSTRQSGTRVFVPAAFIVSLPAVVVSAFVMGAMVRHAHSLWSSIFWGLAFGLGVGLLLARLIAKRFLARHQSLVRGITAGSVNAAEHQARVLKYSLLGEIAEAWLATATSLQHAYHEKQSQTQQQSQTLAELMRMFAKAVDERTPYLRGHSERVAAYSEQIAREMGFSAHETERIRLSGLLHDIGTLGIDDHIMAKEETLTAEEFDAVKAHPLRGAAILRPIEALNDLIPGLELHHEALDGSGYPYGLKADEIPMMARVVAVADSFDAMTTWRPYQSPMDPMYTVEVLRRLAAKRYDGDVVAALYRLLQRGAIVVPVTRPLFDDNQPRRLRLVR